MSLSVLPTWSARSLDELTVEFLKEKEISLVMLDFDNTVVPYTSDTPTAEIQGWLEALCASDIALCVVSNSYKPRVRNFCRARRIKCITGARKPFGKGIRRCLERYELPPEKALVVGDQVFTDTLGGNLAGTRTVLLEPIHNHLLIMKLRYLVELPFRALSKNRRLTK